MKTLALIFLLALLVTALNSLSIDSNPPLQYDVFGGQIDDHTGRGAIGQ